MSTPSRANAAAPPTTGAPVSQRRRTGWDIGLGVLMVAGAIVILGDVTLATVISVALLGWTALISGVVLIAGTLWRLRSGGSWSPLLGAVGLAVLGLFILRNPMLGALTFTLLAGSLFLTTGLTRIFASGRFGPDRWFVVISGLISLGLGLFVLLNLVTATLTMVGVLLGVQLLVEGLTLLVAGRVHDPVPPRTASEPVG